MLLKAVQSLQFTKPVTIQPFIFNLYAGMRNIIYTYIYFFYCKALEHQVKFITKPKLRSLRPKLQLCSLAVKGCGSFWEWRVGFSSWSWWPEFSVTSAPPGSADLMCNHPKCESETNSPGKGKQVVLTSSPVWELSQEVGKVMHPEAAWEHSHSYSFPDGQHCFIN